jgi:RNA polymerase sigma factor (sigma-70 family)
MGTRPPGRVSVVVDRLIQTTPQPANCTINSSASPDLPPRLFCAVFESAGVHCRVISPNDRELLRRFVTERDHDAFAVLVQRHIGLVYHSALRRVGGSHAAEDITQQVFTTLARKAAQLGKHEALAGWLHTTGRYEAHRFLRAERRRVVREQEAAMLDDVHGGNPSHDWARLRPVIDGALDELSGKDRDAVLMRYFTNESYAAIGDQLGVSENAARMRVDRALEKLNGILKARDITSVSLAAALATEAVAGATPSALATQVTAQALASTTLAATTGAAAIFTMITSKATIASVLTLLVVGAGTSWSVVRTREARLALAEATQREATLRLELAEVQRRVGAATKQLREAEAANSELLAAARKMKAAQTDPAAEVLITSQMVSTRFKHAQQLVQNGDAAEAFNELLWCYNVGMPKIRGMGPVRSTSLQLFGRLAERYPPAADFLRSLRDNALPRVRASETDSEALSEYAGANKALKDDAANVSLLDELPAGDRRRRTLASASDDYLLEKQRYNEAAEGKPYSSISSVFELMTQDRPIPAGAPDAAEVREKTRSFVITNTAKNIEMLAGVGDLAHARSLADRLLAYDGSEATKTLIQQHAARAGHADLLTSATQP